MKILQSKSASDQKHTFEFGHSVEGIEDIALSTSKETEHIALYAGHGKCILDLI
jgi:hypothetical protein